MKIETIDYKKAEADVYLDDDMAQIFFEDETKNRDDVFLVAFHQKFTVERDGFSKERCDRLLGYENNIEEEDIEEYYYVFGLEAYIHGGVKLALSFDGNFPNRNWDVSQIGCVFVKIDDVKNHKEAEEKARDYIKYINLLLDGSVYFVEIKDKKTKQRIDRFSGFVTEKREELEEEIKNRIERFYKTYKKFNGGYLEIFCF